MTTDNIAQVDPHALVPKPSLGRVVLFRASDGLDYAGFVTRVVEGRTINLVTFGDTSTYHHLRVPQALVGAGPGSWRWPERT